MWLKETDRMFWENSINTRRSVRSFERRAVDGDVMEQLKEFTVSLEVPFSHSIETRFFKSREGIAIGNSLLKPPEDAVAFLSETDLLSLAKVGFWGELVLLYANALGLSTCWYGHYVLPEIEYLLPDINRVPNPKSKYGFGSSEGSERYVVCVSPLGYWKSDGLRALDRFASSLNSFKRKPLDERLLNGITEVMLPEYLRYALDLARKAPSGANTQHWQFAVSEDFKKVVIAKPKGYKHIKWEHPDVCVGCCAAHFWVGLTIQGIASTVVPTVDDDRVIWTFDLGDKTNDA